MKPLAVSSPWSPAPVLYLPRTASTMEEALRLYRGGSPGGTVVAAGYQSRGRGRREGRAWRARAGRNLLFTIVLDRLPAMPPQRLPVLAGLAVADCLQEHYGLRAELKWPNDLLCEGRKLAGVLCEARAEGPQPLYLVGIGVNCNQRRFPGPLERSAVSLVRLLGRAVDRWVLLEGILRHLAACLQDPLWQDRLTSRLAGRGRPAVVRTEAPGGRELEGVIEGIAEDGALLLRPAGSAAALALYSGELTTLPGRAASG